MLKLWDSNGKYNNREYNCAHCFNINAIVWYAKTKEKNIIFSVSNIILGGITGAIINAQVWLEIYYVIKTN